MELIKGQYVQISDISFPLRELATFFSEEDMRFMFGESAILPEYLDEIEADPWSRHWVYTHTLTGEMMGDIRLIVVTPLHIAEIHGGGVNQSTIARRALVEAWHLMLDYCINHLNIKHVNTTCSINNHKAYRFITKTGFKEIQRMENENRIRFDFQNEYYIDNCNRYVKTNIKNI